MISFSIWDMVRHLLTGAGWTIVLSAIAFALGGVMGLIVLFVRISPKAQMRALAMTYIEFFQDTPLLMQFFLIFFGLALFGVDISPLAAATLGLTFFTSAYLAEIWRGCVEALPKGQWEASACLAMNRYEQLRHVILPQALRIAIPPTVGFSVQVVKGTAVASIIGLVAAGYFLMCYPLSAFARRIERRLHVAGRR